MPRSRGLETRVKLAQEALEQALSKPTLPRLWNAKRRIKSGRLIRLAPEHRNSIHEDQGWKKLVSEDVVKFIEDAGLSKSERRACVADPNTYFSIPQNVPTALRKQVYFPNFTITLRRTPDLPPKYAAFNVPLWFNKLDMKDYLKSVYGVEVLHVRSTVIQAKIKRKTATSPYSQGQIYRPPSKKKMTVELVEPFVWPEPVEDLSPWETDTFYAGQQYAIDANKQRGDIAKSQPDKLHRKSIAQQAKDLLAGKSSWKPTWESIPSDARVLKPFDPKKLSSFTNARTVGRSTSAPR